MRAWYLKALVLLIGSFAYWYLVCFMTGENESWDAGSYWLVWYPVSLGLSALGGYALQRQGWIGGVIVTFAQFPVMVMINGELGALFAAGLILLVGLAIPAAAISMSAARVSIRT